MRKRILLFVFAISLFTSCLSVKPESTKSAKNLFETFFVGDEGTQYFIKPITFENSKKEKLEMDFTFRYYKKLTNKDTVNVKFSVISPSIIKEIDQFKINEVSSIQQKLMYNEKAEANYLSRFQAKFLLQDLKKAFSNPKKVSMRMNDLEKFHPTTKSQKKISALNNAVFSLF